MHVWMVEEHWRRLGGWVPANWRPYQTREEARVQLEAFFDKSVKRRIRKYVRDERSK